jgi:hypothetical protein
VRPSLVGAPEKDGILVINCARFTQLIGTFHLCPPVLVNSSESSRVISAESTRRRLEFGRSLHNPSVPLHFLPSVFASSEFHFEGYRVLPQIDANECLLWHSACWHSAATPCTLDTDPHIPNEKNRVRDPVKERMSRRNQSEVSQHYVKYQGQVQPRVGM